MSNVRVERWKGARRAVLYVSGAVDGSTFRELEEALQELVSKRYSDVTVDLTEVTFMSSVGWGLLLGSHHQLRVHGGTLVLAGMQPGLRHVYEMIGLRTILRERRPEPAQPVRSAKSKRRISAQIATATLAAMTLAARLVR